QPHSAAPAGPLTTPAVHLTTPAFRLSKSADHQNIITASSVTMKGVILLMLLGACWGLRANLEYKYRYSGRVASGIPSLLHQFAGAGLQADVTVQVTGDHKIFFKLDNIEVGEYHDVLECDDTQAPLPIHYHPLVEGKELLEKPFEYHGVDSPVGGE
ncbi:hypothetical protein OTU49_000829, partial [Cherax quadricarinatus]